MNKKVKVISIILMLISVGSLFATEGECSFVDGWEIWTYTDEAMATRSFNRFTEGLGYPYQVCRGLPAERYAYRIFWRYTGGSNTIDIYFQVGTTVMIYCYYRMCEE